MQLKNFINGKVIIFFLFFVAFSSLKARYEVSFHIEDQNGNPLAGMSFQVYTLATDSMSWKLIGSASSLGTPFWTLNGKFVNAAISIYAYDGQVFVPASQAQTIAIKIGSQIIRMDYGGELYGDALITIPYSGAWSIDQGNSSYTFTGPQAWHNNQINLSNSMGGDAGPNVQGAIHFNSLTDTVGTTPVSYLRESTTFLDGGHNVRGEDNQLVGQYYRKWRKFSEETGSSISIYLSNPNDYSRTATYARQFNITYQNYFNSSDNGGTIKLKGTSKSSPYSTNFYEDSTYNLEAANTTRNNVYYTFDHWEFQGSSVGSSNPYNSYPPTGSGTLHAVFNHKPVNYYRNLTFNDGAYGDPVELTWHKHDLDNSFVTQYAIHRKVKHNGVMGNDVLIETITARDANHYSSQDSTYTFIDIEYVITNGYTDDLLYYDVRAYYNPNYSDADYAAVFGKMGDASMNELKQNVTVASELPMEYSLSNYPNPFNPSTTINYQLPKNGFVTIKVFDLLGKEVATLVSGNKSAGYYSVSFDASKLTSGVYICTINVNGFAQSKKMLLMK